MGKSGVQYTTDIESVSISSGAKASHNRVGLFTAFFLIVNKLVGTGIFATPGTIFKNAGSPGLALILWFIGTLISFAGLLVYMEFGIQIPKNGAEKNYLEYVYWKPKFFTLSLFAAYICLLNASSSNAVAFGSYILSAAGVDEGRWNTRVLGVVCLSFVFVAHSVTPNWALRLANVLGIFKMVVLLMIIIIGWVYWAGGAGNEPTHNLSHSFAGESSAYGVITALYSVIWSFFGYSNANYILAEAKDPVKTLKYAAPAGFITVSILYMLANISYLGVVPLERIKHSGIVLAADFFDIVWGSKGRSAISVFVALSALGNVIVVTFSNARLVQELGRSGVLPFSSFWATMKPFHTPMFALFEHYVISLVFLLAPPPGDAFHFTSNLATFPTSLINGLVALALIIIYLRRKTRYPEWNPSFRATLPVAFFYFIGNLYLVVAPFIPPTKPSQNQYKSLPYYLHCVVGLSGFGVGLIYWIVAFKLWPWLRGYVLVPEVRVDSEGWEQTKVGRRQVNPNPILNFHSKKIVWLEKLKHWIIAKSAWVEAKSEAVETRSRRIENSIVSKLLFWKKPNSTEGHVTSTEEGKGGTTIYTSADSIDSLPKHTS